ncbi:hypothetical protein ASD00_04605 [Ensifer sp. Root31]|nr:hypothetical protein ASD00_04605 [Ensifer sp. Root31]
MWPEKDSVSTVVIVVGISKTFAAFARPTTLFFSTCRSIDWTPNAICGCWSMKMSWLLTGVRTSSLLDMDYLLFELVGSRASAAAFAGFCGKLVW